MDRPWPYRGCLVAWGERLWYFQAAPNGADCLLYERRGHVGATRLAKGATAIAALRAPTPLEVAALLEREEAEAGTHSRLVGPLPHPVVEFAPFELAAHAADYSRLYK